MSDLPMTHVWGIHEAVISIGASPGVSLISGGDRADGAGKNALHGNKERSCH